MNNLDGDGILLVIVLALVIIIAPISYGYNQYCKRKNTCIEKQSNEYKMQLIIESDTNIKKEDIEEYIKLKYDNSKIKEFRKSSLIGELIEELL